MVRYSFGTRLTRLSDEEGRNRAGTCITVMTREEFREGEGDLPAPEGTAAFHGEYPLLQGGGVRRLHDGDFYDSQ